MAAPSFVQASTGATDIGGAWLATGAAGTSGNVVILQILQDGPTTGAVALTSATNIENLAGTDNAWTYIGEFVVVGDVADTPSPMHLWIGRLINTSAPTAGGTNSTSEDLYWRFYEFSNVNTGTTLAAVIEQNGTTTPSTSQGTSGTIADAGVTTTGPDRLALNFIGIDDDNPISEFTGETGGGDWTEAVAEYAEASGTDGSIGLQITGAAWTANDHGGANANYSDIAYGNGYWAACHTLSGGLYYKASTPDGAWTSNAQGTDQHQGIAYDNGYWVLVGGNGTLYYKASTPDGAWTSNTQGTTTFNSVAYGNGYWVAVGNTGTLRYKASTPDGAWTSNAQGTESFQRVAYANGYWVAVGNNGTLYYKASTPDGAWTSNAQGTTNLSGLAYGNGYWVAVGNPNGAVLYKASTPDGSWTSNTQGTASLVNVHYADGYWVAVGWTVETLLYKALTPDGVWTKSNQGTVEVLSVVSYGNGYWVVGGTDGRLRYRTTPQLGATTINGGTFTQADATDGWGVVGFALIGTTPSGPVSLIPNIERRTPRRRILQRM